jgi:hypothetical protein
MIPSVFHYLPGSDFFRFSLNGLWNYAINQARFNIGLLRLIFSPSPERNSQAYMTNVIYTWFEVLLAFAVIATEKITVPTIVEWWLDSGPWR